jgi:hypothetical protein
MHNSGGSRPLQPWEPRPLPGAGGPDAAADPEQRGRPVGAGEHAQAQVRRMSVRLTRSGGPVGGPVPSPEELLVLVHVRKRKILYNPGAGCRNSKRLSVTPI